MTRLGYIVVHAASDEILGVVHATDLPSAVRAARQRWPRVRTRVL